MNTIALAWLTFLSIVAIGLILYVNVLWKAVDEHIKILNMHRSLIKSLKGEMEALKKETMEMYEEVEAVREDEMR